MMQDFKELIKFLLGFSPWLLFLFISGHTLASLERAIIICFLVSFLLGFRDLCKGFILQWGTLFFFITCLITINLMKLVFVAENMGIVSNGFLASIVWVTILIRKPFTLQYARSDLPRERWDDPGVLKSCRFIAIVWALILTFSTLVSIFRVFRPHVYSSGFYFDISLATMLGGSIFTVLYKKYKRNQRLRQNKEVVK
ncbi:MAG: hypothetical protein HZC15_03350 [Candidatus Omnitrophica bacterium]|nr:hypothetical protein [Candidatus Omnitrophota bacterium]